MDMHAFKGDSDPDEELTISGAGSPTWIMCLAEEQEKKNRCAELPSQSLQACVLKEYTAAP